MQGRNQRFPPSCQAAIRQRWKVQITYQSKARICAWPLCVIVQQEIVIRWCLQDRLIGIILCKFRTTTIAGQSSSSSSSSSSWHHTTFYHLVWCSSGEPWRCNHFQGFTTFFQVGFCWGTRSYNHCWVLQIMQGFIKINIWTYPIWHNSYQNIPWSCLKGLPLAI